MDEPERDLLIAEEVQGPPVFPSFAAVWSNAIRQTHWTDELEAEYQKCRGYQEEHEGTDRGNDSDDSTR
jgi:hypothetical protein